MRPLLAAIVALSIALAGDHVVNNAPRAEANPITARVTFYVLRGVMYSGYTTHWGAAACSWNLPIGTQVQMPNGQVFTCLDRGHLGWSGWVDIWVPDMTTGRWLAAQYGDFSEVTVTRWGWG